MDPAKDTPVLLGLLLGWKRYPAPSGSILRLQVSRSAAAAKHGEYCEHDLSISAIQMRQLGEDLIRAADERDGRLPTPRHESLWQRLRATSRH